jgi:hypothetical protein
VADQKKWERIDAAQQAKLDNLTEAKDTLLKTANTGTAEERRVAAITFTKSLGEMIELRNEFAKAGDTEGLNMVNAMLSSAQTQASQAAGMLACRANEPNCLATQQGLQNFTVGIAKGLLNTPTSILNIPLQAIDGFANLAQVIADKPLTPVTPKVPNVVNCEGELQCKGEFVGQMIGGAGLVKGVTTVVNKLDDAADAAASAQATSKGKIELNTRVDDAQQYDQFRIGAGVDEMKSSPSRSAIAGGEWDYPRVAPNDGAVPGTTTTSTATVGTQLDRFGSTNRGTYMAPADTPLEQRGMAPGAAANPYTKVEVIKPFEIVKDEAAPAFVSAGGGQQIRARIPEFKDRFATIDELIEHGYVKGTK